MREGKKGLLLLKRTVNLLNITVAKVWIIKSENHGYRPSTVLSSDEWQMPQTVIHVWVAIIQRRKYDPKGSEDVLLPTAL